MCQTSKGRQLTREKQPMREEAFRVREGLRRRPYEGGVLAKREGPRFASRHIPTSCLMFLLYSTRKAYAFKKSVRTKRKGVSFGRGVW